MQSAAQQVGPYLPLTSIDSTDATGLAVEQGRPVPAVRRIARTPGGDRTVLLSTPAPGVDPNRFMAEADAARYLLGSWTLPTVELAPPGGAPWHARPYVPVLPLPTALALHGGPLPEHTVRALGVALAETLSVIHGQSLVHAGLSPTAVLLSFDGPRLDCFGAVRAAAPEGAVRRDLPGVDATALAPEQAAGGQPRPLGDVYGLGATLACAATGHTVPEREELPASLRSLVSRCLSRDPVRRPQLAEVVAELSAGTGAARQPAGFGTTDHASALLTPGWLPARLVAALAHQSASVLDADMPAPGAYGY
ncbi:serine/threonine-protein kinase [Streptomyces endophyticus]|uniref:Serine/threonine protein kinase n=1 Tax=Streptomyces endophyticus TaxID=714166 RepID=A0ABU6EZI2_9ACTN|nr:serine/threonine protein kinase [Streptomyces endophyticus]MEB8336782.1 serine/threonine protein kinase [Streptomyces endophyticus]